jgi:FkbM family methyltransferase
VREIIKRLARSLGYSISRYAPAYHCEARRISLLKQNRIDLVLDVGANSGQYGVALRRLGYMDRIVSFEPLSGVFGELCKTSRKDKTWDTYNYGLGDFDGIAEINIAANTASSSLLNMLPLHSEMAPESAYVGTERVVVKKLDSVFQEILDGAKYPFMKIDTQGYTKPVLDGARKSLERICGIQVEIALTPLYAGELLLPDMLKLLIEEGYSLMSIEPNFADPVSGRLLQVDCIFFREET